MEKVSNKSGKSKMRKAWAVTALGAAAIIGGGMLFAGCNGETTKSAYDIAVEKGFVGTEAEWLESLKGKSAYDIAVENGFTGTEAEWLASLIGANGSTGQNGTNGKSAYELAVERGFVGTEAEWLESLRGEMGPTGDQGDLGVGIQDVAVELVYQGSKMFYQFTITFTNPNIAPQVILAPVPQVVSYINLETNYVPMIEAGADMPDIFITAYHDDESKEVIRVTKDMFVTGGGYVKPDFTTQGEYNVKIKFRGAETSSTITVYDEAQTTLEQVYGVAEVKVGEGSLEDVYLAAEYSNDSLNAFTKMVKLTNEMITAGEVDWDTRGEYILNVTYEGINGFVMVDVYDPSLCNISNVNIKDGSESLEIFQIEAGADIEEFVNTNIVGKNAVFSLYEPVDEQQERTEVITLDMVDYSKVDTSLAGEQVITIKYTLPGDSIEYTKDFVIAVEYNLTGSATIGGSVEGVSTLGISDFANFAVYEGQGTSGDKAVVVLTTEGGSDVQYAAELLDTDSDGTADVIKIYQYEMGGFVLYSIAATTVNDVTRYVLTDYVPAGETKTTLKYLWNTKYYVINLDIAVCSEDEFTLGTTTGTFYANVAGTYGGSTKSLGVVEVVFEMQSDSTYTVSALGQTYTIDTTNDNTLSPYVAN